MVTSDFTVSFISTISFKVNKIAYMNPLKIFTVAFFLLENLLDETNVFDKPLVPKIFFFYIISINTLIFY